MIDFERIGKRILEERKYLHHISQEKMAEDLGLYQADISNLEKAKNGSGITDLTRLDMIADYFGMPLDALIFGRRHEQMEKYTGQRMQLRENREKMPRRHETLLAQLLGVRPDGEDGDAVKRTPAFSCGPYLIYVPEEVQYVISGTERLPHNALKKLHLYVIFQDEVIGCLTAAVTRMPDHLCPPALQKLKELILPDIFDVDDTLHLLDPYALLAALPLGEAAHKDAVTKARARMDELRAAGEDRTVYYIETAYVREDCRQNGILRMMVDILKIKAPDAMIRLSLEPTSGAELTNEYGFYPAYQASELGQLHLNASIAERLGFTIDSATVSRQAERVDEDGSIVTETVPVRRNAYYLPRKLRSILANDGDTLAVARAARRLTEGQGKKWDAVDIYQGAWKKYGFVMAIKMVFSSGTVFAFARGKSWTDRRLGVSRDNPADTGQEVETLESYLSLKEAENSVYYIGLRVAEQLLGAIFFGTVKPEEVQMDLLEQL